MADKGAENKQLSEALHLARTDVNSLQRASDEVECAKAHLKLKLEDTENQLDCTGSRVKALEVRCKS